MSELYDKMLAVIRSKAVITYLGTGDVYSAKECERLAIQAQVDLLEDLKNDTENTNAKFRLKLATMINELESKIK